MSKLKITNYIKNKHDNKKLPFTILRLFPTYGPLENDRKIFPYLIKNLKREKIVEVTSGKQIRNYTYVDDMVKGIIKSIESKKTINKSLILANKKSYTLKKIILKIAKIMNVKKNLIKWEKFKRNDESLNFMPNLNETNKLINWHPKTSLESGIKKMLKFIN